VRAPPVQNMASSEQDEVTRLRYEKDAKAMLHAELEMRDAELEVAALQTELEMRDAELEVAALQTELAAKELRQQELALQWHDSVLKKKEKPAGVSTDDSPDTVTARHDEVPSPLKLPAAKEGSCCHEESVPVAMILLLAPCLPDFTSCVDPTWAVLLVTVLVGFLATRMRWSTALVMLGSLSVMVASRAALQTMGISANATSGCLTALWIVVGASALSMATVELES